MTKFEKMVRMAQSMTLKELHQCPAATHHLLLSLAQSALDYKKLPFAHPDMATHRKAPSKIACIKLYRELTGVGLADAKDAVEGHFGLSGWEP